MQLSKKFKDPRRKIIKQIIDYHLDFKFIPQRDFIPTVYRFRQSGITIWTVVKPKRSGYWKNKKYNKFYY